MKKNKETYYGQLTILKTDEVLNKKLSQSLYNLDPLKPQCYIVKLGFIYRGIHYFFLVLLKKTDCGYNLYFEQKYVKYQIFLSENVFDYFLVLKFLIYLNRCVFSYRNENNKKKQTRLGLSESIRVQ